MSDMDETTAFSAIKASFQRWKAEGYSDEVIIELQQVAREANNVADQVHAIAIRGAILTESNRWDEAVSAFLEGMNLQQSEFSKFHLMLELADAYFMSGSAIEGVQWINAAMEIPMQDASVYVGPAYKIFFKHQENGLHSDIHQRLDAALRLNWNCLLPERPFPASSAEAMMILDANERDRHS